VCHVSAVSRGCSPGNCFSQLGPKLSVITGEAFTSRPRSPPIMMRWWSALSNITQKCRSPLVELANTTSSVTGSTKRGISVQARAASPSTWRAFTLLLNGEARCGSKPARWRFRAVFTKERIRLGIPKEPTCRDMIKLPPFCLDGPTEKRGWIKPRTKSARARNTLKSWKKFDHLRIAGCALS
jgi:hypothetical protein